MQKQFEFPGASGYQSPQHSGLNGYNYNGECLMVNDGEEPESMQPLKSTIHNSRFNIRRAS